MARYERLTVSVLEFDPYTVAGAPPAADGVGQTIYVSNGAGGSPILATSDGTDWLRSDTGAAISEV